MTKSELRYKLNYMAISAWNKYYRTDDTTFLHIGNLFQMEERTLRNKPTFTEVLQRIAKNNSVKEDA